jgi:O-antigen biosynthesis alpha-1,2-rhamnosyltransferase
MTSVSAGASSCGTRSRTIFIECTHTFHSDINTGIQRVVRNIIRNSIDGDLGHNFIIVPVVVENGCFRAIEADKLLQDKQVLNRQSGRQPTAKRVPLISRFGKASRDYAKSLYTTVVAPLPRPLYRYARAVIAALLPFQAVRTFVWAPRSEYGLTRILSLPLAALHRKGRLAAESSNTVAGTNGCPSNAEKLGSAGDILLLLDSSWSIPVWGAVRAFKAQGGFVIGVIYDLIPVSHPHACVPELTAAFSEWLRHYCALSDGTIAISQTVMHQFEMYNAFCGRKRWTGVDAPIRYFHLGSELDFARTQPLSSLRSARIGEAEVPTFLMVGSIEPRKNHALVLAAFERLWAEHTQIRLVLIGRQAWRTDELLARISAHPKLNESLILRRDASDTELEEYYKSSTALIIASEIEGFGLPIIEAYQRGLPVICSDIPVFREIAGDAATYFDLDDPTSLPRVITDFLHADGTVRQELPRPLTWRESAGQLLTQINSLMHSISKREPDTVAQESR